MDHPTDLDEEAACARWLFDLRWGEEFACRVCGHAKASQLAKRPRVWGCHACRGHNSVTAGTCLHRSRVPLVKVMIAAEEMAKAQSISGRALERLLGVSHETAWALLQRLRAGLVADTGGPRREDRGNRCRDRVPAPGQELLPGDPRRGRRDRPRRHPRDEQSVVRDPSAVGRRPHELRVLVGGAPPGRAVDRHHPPLRARPGVGAVDRPVRGRAGGDPERPRRRGVTARPRCWRPRCVCLPRLRGRPAAAPEPLGSELEGAGLAAEPCGARTRRAPAVVVPTRSTCATGSSAERERS